MSDAVVLVLSREDAIELRRLFSKTCAEGYDTIETALNEVLDYTYASEKNATEWLRQKYGQLVLLRHGESPLDAARGLIGKDYFADVRGIVDDVLQAIKDGEIADHEQLHDYVWESLDGCSRVIYTAQAQAALLVSQNDGVGVDDGLIGPDDFRDGIPWSKLCFAAMQADVYEELGRRNIDMNEPVSDPDDVAEWWFGEHEPDSAQIAEIIATKGECARADLDARLDVPRALEPYLTALVRRAEADVSYTGNGDA